MNHHYQVINTTVSDLPVIYELFDHSIAYQEAHGFPVWKNYDRNAIIQDIDSGNQYKILMDDRVGIVFSVGYTDKIIWRTLDRGDSLYLHRIVVNPVCKGHKLFGKILEWSISHAKLKGLKNIRMDTWADNLSIINYYQGFGFSFIENYTTPDRAELPVHNRNLSLTLLQYTIGDMLG